MICDILSTEAFLISNTNHLVQFYTWFTTYTSTLCDYITYFYKAFELTKVVPEEERKNVQEKRSENQVCVMSGKRQRGAFKRLRNFFTLVKP